MASECRDGILRPLLVQLAETGALLDYEVRGVRSVRQRRRLGYFDTPDGQKRLVSAAEEERDPRSGVPTGADAGRPFETAVTVRRRGDIVLPVTIAFKFEGRPAERLVWDGQPRAGSASISPGPSGSSGSTSIPIAHRCSTSTG